MLKGILEELQNASVQNSMQHSSKKEDEYLINQAIKEISKELPKKKDELENIRLDTKGLDFSQKQKNETLKFIAHTYLKGLIKGENQALADVRKSLGIE